MNYGLTINLHNKSKEEIKIKTSSLIAIVAGFKEEKINFFNSVSEAKNEFNEGAALDFLNDLDYSQYTGKVVISSFALAEGQEEEEENIKKALGAIEKLKGVKALFNQDIKFIISSFSHLPQVQIELKKISDYLRAFYSLDLKTTDLKSTLENLNTTRAIISIQNIKRIDDKNRALGPFLISSYAQILANNFGFSESISNKPLKGIKNIIDLINFEWGSECEANALRAQGVFTVFNDEGFKAWGGESVKNAMFKSLHTQMIYDEIINTLFKSLKTKVDNKVSDILGDVIDDLNKFYRDLVGASVLIGFEISVPLDLNTNESLAKGEIYINHKSQEMPLAKNIINNLYRVNEYGEELIKKL